MVKSNCPSGRGPQMGRKEINPDLGDAEDKTRKMLALRQEGQISPSLVERMVGK